MNSLKKLTNPTTGLIRRHLSTSAQMQFKFKLTEEMSREFEDKLKSQEQPVKELALHTRESSLVMGRVSHDRFKLVVKVAVPKHRFNDHLLLYRRENDDVMALDQESISKPGDWVLLRRDDSIVDKAVTHRIERVVYSYGNFVDPLTGRRSLGLYYDDHMERLEKIKLEL